MYIHFNLPKPKKGLFWDYHIVRNYHKREPGEVKKIRRFLTSHNARGRHKLGILRHYSLLMT